MAFGMVVRLPVSVAYGTDEEFDLRVQLEQELATALAGAGVGRSAGSEIDTSHMNLNLVGLTDPLVALVAAKEVLARNGLLGRAVIELETISETDPDERDRLVLWPPTHASAFRVA